VTDARPGPDASDKAANSSLGELLGEVTRDFSTLMRQELELAKAELRESATRAGRGVGMYGGAGIAGHLALVFLSIAAWLGLGQLIGLGWSAVIVAVVYAVVALILFVIGRNELKSIKGMPQTAESVKRIPEALKPEETR
jgi:hypothetical protein